jgi:hypothetical protein
MTLRTPARAAVPLAALTVLLGLSTAIGPAGASRTSVPRPCQLLTQQLVEGYFHADMVKTGPIGPLQECDWQARFGRYRAARGASLILTTWRLHANAVAAITAVCGHVKGGKQLQLPGAAKACGFEAPTGLCLTQPKGEDPKDFCQWDVVIKFLRGSTTGSLELSDLTINMLNDLRHGATLARSLLKGWK